MTKPKAKAPVAAVKSAVKRAQPTPPAHKSATKPAAKVVSKPVAGPASKPGAKVAPKPASKPSAKVAPKPAAKSAAAAAPKPAPKPVSKPPIKPAAKPVPESVLKPTAAPAATPAVKVAAKPAVKAAVAASAPTPVSTPAVAPKPATKPATRSSTRGIPAVAPASPPSNRFTDRFAPARHLRAPDPIEVQKSTYKADPKLVNAWKTKPGRELSVPELLAMPDSEYMNDKQVDFFRVLLRSQRDELLSNAGETTEHLREDTTIVPDPADRATIEEEHALELRTRDRERKLLKKISQSLTRLDSNEYGFCDETGEPIGLNRLLARPTATLSLEAQQRRELKQKMFGD